MKIVPTAIERQVKRVDPQRSLMIAISFGLLALWSAYRVIWSISLSLTYDFLFGSLVFQIALWGVVGTAAAIAAIAFFQHHSHAERVDIVEENLHH